MKKILLYLTLFVSIQTFAQSENVFLDRAYWKEQPSVEQVKSDIEKGNDPSAFNNHKFNAITWAILEDASDEVIWLLLNQEGNDVNKRAHDGRTPIFWAAYRGNLQLMKDLIKKGAKTDLLDSHGYSLVNFAANTGQLNTELYDLCIDEGAKLEEEVTKDGANPLLLILPHLKSTELIAYFTSKGLSLEKTDANGNNAFAYAAKAGNQEIMDYLLDSGISPTANNSSAVIFASRGTRGKKNGIETFKYLQSKGLSMKATDSDKKTALHYLASRSGDSEVIDFFLAQGLSLNVADGNGETPFLLAFQQNSPEMVAYLLSKQAFEKGTTNTKGENVIHLATKRGDAEVLQLAIDSETGMDELSEDGLAPLHIAAMKSKDFKLIEVLLNAGADKSVQTPFEETAYDLAMENEWLTDKKQVKKLLK